MPRVETFYTYGKEGRGKVSKLENTAYMSSTCGFGTGRGSSKSWRLQISKKHGHAILKEWQSKVGIC